MYDLPQNMRFTLERVVTSRPNDDYYRWTVVDTNTGKVVVEEKNADKQRARDAYEAELKRRNVTDAEAAFILGRLDPAP